MEFQLYIREARRRYLNLELETARNIKNIFARTANRLRDYLYSLPEQSLQRKYYNELLAYIERLANELNDDLLKQIAQGRNLAIKTLTDHAQNMFMEIAKGIWREAEVEAMFTALNERALIALTTRTRAYGIKVSDRIWRISQDARTQLKNAIEEGIAMGRDPRKVARDIQALLNPGVRTELRKETRKRLAAPKDVCMEAMRLAVTEMQHAAHEGTIGVYSKMPPCEGFYWRLSNNHPLTDICDEYARHNGDGFWEKDEVPVKPHPWCRCYLVPKMKKPEEVREDLRAWINNPLNKPEIEAWYQSVRDILPRPSLTTLQQISTQELKETKANILGIKKLKRARTHEEAVKIAKELNLIDNVFYDKSTIDIHLANDMNKALFNIMSDFPQLKKSLYFKRADGTMAKYYFDFLKYYHPSELQRMDEALNQKLFWDEFQRYWSEKLREIEEKKYVGAYYYDYGLITYYYKWGKSGSYNAFKNIVEHDANIGFNPKNGNKPIFVAYHEIGHAIHAALGIIREDRILRDGFIQEKWEYFKSLSKPLQITFLSEYADWTPQEMLAEAWASYCMEKYEKNGQASAFAKEIGEYIEKKLREFNP